MLDSLIQSILKNHNIFEGTELSSVLGNECVPRIYIDNLKKIRYQIILILQY